MKKIVGQIAYIFLILAIIALGLWVLSLISQTVLYVVLAVLILLVMVMIHEFGHYLAGKILKFKINEFAIGFGPKLLSFKRKNGEIFSVRLFPLGGFCAFEGEEEEDETKEKPSTQPDPFSEYSSGSDVTAAKKTFVEGGGIYGNSYGHKNPIESSSSVDLASNSVSDRQRENSQSELKRFNDQAPWKRIVVLFSGGAFNLLSAIIFSFIFILAVGYEQPKIAGVHEIPENPGQYYNQLVEGDILLAIDGEKIGIMRSYNEMLSSVKLGESITVTVLREGEETDVVLTKQKITITNEKDDTTEVFEGFGFTRELNFAKTSVWYALKYSVPFTAKLAWSILGAFGGIFTGRVGLTELSGPVGTIDAIAEVSAMNWRNIFLLLPLIAANLGLFNLFPIPALDGSKIIFTVIEWIRKKPINRNIEAYIHLVGMVALLLFVIVIDIISYIL